MIRNLLLVLSLAANIFGFYLMWNLIYGYNPGCTGHHIEAEATYQPPTKLRM